MSRTRRKDPIDTRPKRPDIVFLGQVINTTPTAAEVAKAHRDGKPSGKPGRAAKVALQKGRKAKVRKALSRVVEDPEAAVLPTEPKTDVWNYT